MPTINAEYSRDNNRVPITTYGFTNTKSVTFVGSNTTVAVPLFTVTGTVKFLALYGIVTTTVGVNHTAAYWRINDATATPSISASSGTTISAAAVGSYLTRISVAAVALTLANASAARITDPVAATAPDVFMPFVITGKVAVTSNIEYVYTTTDTPTTGAIKFFAKWLPLSDDGAVTSL